MAGLRQLAAALVWISGCAAPCRAEFPVLSSCSDATEIMAKISNSDPVEVHFGLAEGDQTCYSVTVRVGNNRVRGYLLGKGHPAVAEFERKRANSVPIGPPAPPAPPKVVAAKAPLPEKPAGPSSFAGLRGVDYDGRTIDLDRVPASRVVLYFWNPRDRQSVKATKSMEYIYQQYHSQGVEVIGVATAASPSALREACGLNEVTWPQIFDTGAIARRYQVDSSERFFVLDRQKNVLKALPSSGGIEAVLQSKTLRAEAKP